MLTWSDHGKVLHRRERHIIKLGLHHYVEATAGNVYARLRVGMRVAVAYLCTGCSRRFFPQYPRSDRVTSVSDGPQGRLIHQAVSTNGVNVRGSLPQILAADRRTSWGLSRSGHRAACWTNRCLCFGTQLTVTVRGRTRSYPKGSLV